MKTLFIILSFIFSFKLWAHTPSTLFFVLLSEQRELTESIKSLDELDAFLNDDDKSYQSYHVLISYFKNGGENASILSYTKESDFDELVKIMKSSEFDFLATPDIKDEQTEIFIEKSKALGALVNEKKSFYIMDVRYTENLEELESDLTALKVGEFNKTTIFYPLFFAPNSTDKVLSNSGILAGIYSKSEKQNGIWKAAAGVNFKVHNDYRPVKLLSRSTCDYLSTRFSLTVNCFYSNTSTNTVVWGGRVAKSSDGEKKYINIARFADHLDKTISKRLSWVQNARNSEITWRTMRRQVNAILSSYMNKGAFASNQTQEAYFFRVGLGQTMTQADIDNGVIRLTYGIAPLRKAEFLINSIEIKKAP